MNVPSSKLARKYTQERELSEEEDDISLMELIKPLRNREQRQELIEKTEDKDIEYNDEKHSDNLSSLSFFFFFFWNSLDVTMTWI